MIPLSKASAAVKIGLLMKFPQKSSEIVKVNIQQLYETAIQEHVPFHEVSILLKMTAKTFFPKIIFTKVAFLGCRSIWLSYYAKSKCECKTSFCHRS